MPPEEEIETVALEADVVEEEVTPTEDGEIEAPPAEEEATEEEETVVSIGDEEPPEQEEAPEWVRELRQSHREAKKENKALRKELESLKSPAKPAEAVGSKPTLEEHNYDSDAYEKALEGWYERKRKADEEAELGRMEQEEAQEAWNKRLETYGEKKTALKVKDFDDAEAVVLDTMNETQQGIIVQGAENPALVVYALGKNDARAKELAEIKDPVKFAFAVAKLEKDLKVTNRKQPPPPESRIDGTGPKSGVVDSTLDRLRAKAEKTGDYSEVAAYRRKKRAAS